MAKLVLAPVLSMLLGRRGVVLCLSGSALFAKTIALTAFLVTPAFAFQKDDVIVNPATGLNETVFYVLRGPNGGPEVGVVTSSRNNILTAVPALNATFVDDPDPAVTGDEVTFKVTARTEVNGRVTNYTYAQLDGNGAVISGSAQTQNIVTALTAQEWDAIQNMATNPGGAPGAGAGDVNLVTQLQTGANGSNGSNGYGVRICIPLIGCATIGTSGSGGGAGGNGADIDLAVTDQGAFDSVTGANVNPGTPSNQGNITIATDRPGILAVSQGGSGGKGGDVYGNFAAKPGGSAGAGGAVSVDNDVDISGNGTGIFASSQGGTGGAGGEGYILSSGGSAGSAAQAGAVSVDNSGQIDTTGNGHFGILAQSLGGRGGSGGSSYGIVGDANSGSPGGNGAAVSVIHSGSISTLGAEAHGILAQSIGGSGGSFGDAGGILSNVLGAKSGENDAGGGTGGTVTVELTGTASILTLGDGSAGIVAQSVGGGGGNAGSSFGLVAMGGKSGPGGTGGAVSVTTAAGTRISTGGDAADGIVAQSIGGGGGNGGNSGGALALGSEGAAGGAGGTASVSNAGSIQTAGDGSRGIVVQSIGGGGGNGGNATGALSLGGSGSATSAGGAVTVNHTGSIVTVGDRASAIEAQSIGGGGGSGGAAGGLVSLGGSGGSGGQGGTVGIQFSGSAATSGDDSGGIVAQSVGGGGGNGGGSYSGSAFVGLAMGGSGAKGGDGAAVSVDFTDSVIGHTPTITTEGDRATGVLAQSVGGGGGNGGQSVQVTGGVFGGASVSLGGSGGDGGAGGAVNISQAADITTKGVNSDGLVAQSVGGGGGNGGFAVSVAVAGGPVGGSVAIGLGGSGGKGGNGGDVTLTDAGGDIVTEGDQSDGLVAQSVGGGGGNGGFSVAGAVSGGVAAGAMSLGLGGSGGDGADSAGTVDVTYDGSITTHGAQANGMVLQSVGGGGGNGGFSIAGAVAGSSTASVGVSVGLGGSGGGGGAGGQVQADLDAEIITNGAMSAGIVAQSVGGGGGNGGMNISGALAAGAANGGALTVGLGGSGGGGGAGQAVDLALAGTVATAGATSNALTVQSIGGGGGAGGMNVSASAALTAGSNAAVSVGLGGAGSSGGTGGTVTINTDATLLTQGDGSLGLLAQSVGGGGGAGGTNISGALSVTASNGGSVAVGLGGNGGSGGTAGAVNLTSGGLISTQGRGASGLVAQSLGGGGGAGGLDVAQGISLTSGNGARVAVGLGGSGGNAGDAGAVTVTKVGNIETEGDEAHGLVVQSIGGGGGTGGINASGGLSFSTDGSAAVSVGLGGSGGSSGAGAAAHLDLEGSFVETGGAGSDAITVQSIGGGGGAGGMNIAGGINITSGNGTNGTATIGLGGSGGSGGAGGTVTADIEVGTISATGGTDTRGSSGVIAQSLGGGGGNGGMNISGDIVYQNSKAKGLALTIGLGGSGGGGGAGGQVDLTVASNAISATGFESMGVLAQSVGGGGGAGGFNVSGAIRSNDGLVLGLGGGGGTAGIGGTVTASVTAPITVVGRNARGVVAQSVGGGGGVGGTNVSAAIEINDNSPRQVVIGVGGQGGTGNHGGAVSLTQSGAVQVAGANAQGVVAQSIGGGGGAGGYNLSAGITYGTQDAGNTATAVIGVGGSGGAAGDGGGVTVDSTGAISVDGDTDGNAIGLLAQSIGGGGGTGHFNLTAVATKGSNPLGIAIGGSGGAAGNGGAVTVNRGQVYRSEINTWGNAGVGLLAQSLGGGGGTAGMNLLLAATSGPDDNGPKALSVAIGGDGADPGIGGTVTVDHLGDIYTRGTSSHGLQAQSVGGGGGNANLNAAAGVVKNAASVAVAIGGSPASGATGGAVTVTHDGTIATLGDDSIGLIAQSVGGGGGDTSFNLTGLFKAEKSLSVKLGQQGGNGGDGGTVAVNMSGSLLTAGKGSVGLLAQSVGGGGGKSGTVAVSGAVREGTGNTAKESSTSMEVGLTGGTGGDGGSVTVQTAGLISTAGDNAHGIFAQSVGGGGGAASLILNRNLSDANAHRMGLGGQGGTGGDGAAVNVTNTAEIDTLGSNAIGILAQSVGGGGGTGGMVVTFQLGNKDPDTANIQISQSIGGTGGTGGDGKAVTVVNSGLITSAGTAAHGVLAQSIGGGGGSGGSAYNFALPRPGEQRSFAFVMGGSGGTGGTGDAVSVTNTSTIRTEGKDAAGIMAQSIGGGGGNGGMAISSETSKSDKGNSRITVVLGGDGGNGGTSGAVHVTNAADAIIATEGDGAHGIVAQSLAGGGGNGGLAQVSVKLSAADDAKAQDIAVGLALGGSGGSGNVAGAVTVENAGTILTEGAGAHGVLAQSIGGGGGTGGLALDLGSFTTLKPDGQMISLGGSGGSGNDGGAVHVINSGTIETTGDESHGIVAQSIGGGGGSASASLGAGKDGFVSMLATSAAYGLGMTAGSGGAGGTVTVEHTGSIVTRGAGSRGIVAESINGGGGDLVLDLSSVSMLKLLGQSAPTLTLWQGASASQNMAAGVVTVTGNGDIVALGDGGAGGSIQAVGGGGGTSRMVLGFGTPDGTTTESGGALDLQMGGTDGVGNRGGDIASAHDGLFGSAGDGAPALLLQSIGGGGGRMGLTTLDPEDGLSGGEAVLGATGGSDNGGGSIDHDQTGDIVTEGDLSFGLLAQSVGGGGGFMIWQHQGVVAPALARRTSAAASATVLAAPSAAPAVVPVFTLGGDAVLGSDGADTTISQTGDAVTAGDFSTALLLQSIGGGGGVTVVTGVSDIAVTLGGSNGTTGNGGAVSLTHDGVVQAEGAQSHGIFLQSIGGGGGALMTDASSVALSFSAANSGNGGAISLTQTGNVLALGDRVYGVFAQSVGGGGGFVEGPADETAGFGRYAGTAGGAGTGGAIDLTIDGSVLADGAGSVGVFAQSTGTAGGNITLSLPKTDASVFGGAGGVGVQIDGGADNALVSHGGITTQDGVDGDAILASDGNDRVENFGAIFGSIDLGSGSNGLTNRVDGALVLGDVLAVGSGNLVLNEGLISGGNVNRVMTTAVSGDFEQAAGANLLVDLDFGTQTADRLDISGSADLAGVVVVNINNPETQVAKAQAGRSDTVIVTAGNGLLRPALTLAAPDSAVVKYRLVNAAPGVLAIRSVVDYAAKGLGSANRKSLGMAINRIQTQQRSPDFAPVATRLFFTPKVAALGASYDLMDGSGVVSAQETAFGMQDRFTAALTDRMGARDPELTGAEGWSTLAFGRTELRGNARVGSSATVMNGNLMAGGLDVAVTPNLTLGFGVGIGSSGYQVEDRATTGRIDSEHLGFYGIWHDGAWRVTGSFAAAQLTNEYTRRAVVPGVTLTLPGGTTTLAALDETLKGRQRGTMTTGSIEVGYGFDLGQTDVMPFVGLAQSTLRLSAFDERRAGGKPSTLALHYGGQTVTSIPLTLGVEVRHEGKTAKGGKVTSWLRAAWEHDLSTDRGLKAGFLWAKGGRFGITGTAPDADAISLGAGVSVELDKNVDAYVGLTGRFTESGSDYGAKMGITFKW